MPDRASVFEVTQLGPEVTPGTAVAATKKLLGTTIIPSIKTENSKHRARGSRFTNVAIQNKEWTEADIEQEVGMYTDTGHLLAGLLGMPSTSNPSSGVYLHEWDPLTFTGLTPKTFTVQNGGYVRAQRFPYGLITGLGMEFTRDEVTLSGSMIGQLTEDAITLTAGTAEVQTITASGTVSGGTYTITFMGETTTALAYNASNATILAALLVLPNLATGDVTLGGGALPGTPVTITFGGQYASANVPLISIDGALLTGSTPAYTPTETTPGAALSELALQPISGDEWDFYIDSASGSLGGTKLTRCFACGWNISDMYGPIWVGNTSNSSWVAHVDLPPDTEVKWSVEADSTGMGFRTQLQTGDTRFVRIKCTGPTLGASVYLAQFDFAVKVMDIGDFEDEDGVVAIEYTAEIVHDSTWGKAMSIDLRNGISAIS